MNMSMDEFGSGYRPSIERDGGHHQGLIVTIKDSDNERVGHCWMQGRLKDGDLAMAVRQNGDCFWYYQLIRHDFTLGGGKYDGRRGYQLIEASEFGAYVLGEPYKYQPTRREVHLLLAGETIALDAQPKEAPWWQRGSLEGA